MKTIHPLELEARIETNEPIEIVDLRPRCQFAECHVLGAHSIPFNEFDTGTLVHSRELPLSEPLYVISDRGEHARSAAENMAQCGLDNLVIVEGGMQAWEHRLEQKAGLILKLKLWMMNRKSRKCSRATSLLHRQFWPGSPALIHARP